MISTEWYLYYDDVELVIICSDNEFNKQEV